MRKGAALGAIRPRSQHTCTLTTSISAEEHARWLAAALSAEDRRYWIIEMDGAPVGLANLARIDPRCPPLRMGLLPRRQLLPAERVLARRWNMG